MSVAETLRRAFDTLFPHRTVLSLSRSLQDARLEIARLRDADAAEVLLLSRMLTEAQKERDYFRNRAERLELRLLPEAQQKPERKGKPVMVGRPSWEAVQREHNAKLKAEAEAEAKNKERLGQPSAPNLDSAARGGEDGIQGSRREDVRQHGDGAALRQNAS